MKFSTRKELTEIVINECNCAVKGHAEQLYNCKARVLCLTIPILSSCRVIQPL